MLELGKNKWYYKNFATLSKDKKYVWFWGDQKTRLAFCSGCQWENRFWFIKKDICPKNIVSEIYFIMDKSDLRFIFYSASGNDSDIHRFSNKK